MVLGPEHDSSKQVLQTGSTNDKYPGWGSTYPNFQPRFDQLSLDESPYGEPNQETLGLFLGLPRGSIIADVAGGDGRYAIPLAQQGHDVIVLDIHKPSLLRLEEKIQFFLSNQAGKVSIREENVTQRFELGKQVDALLIAGFAYLLPPDDLDILFRHTTRVLKSGGLFVTEFATERDRRDQHGGSLIGKDEYNYDFEEGMAVLQRLFGKHDMKMSEPTLKTIHFETPYYMHNKLIIASGVKH